MDSQNKYGACCLLNNKIKIGQSFYKKQNQEKITVYFRAGMPKVRPAQQVFAARDGSEIYCKFLSMRAIFSPKIFCQICWSWFFQTLISINFL